MTDRHELGHPGLRLSVEQGDGCQSIRRQLELCLLLGWTGVPGSGSPGGSLRCGEVLPGSGMGHGHASVKPGGVSGSIARRG